MRRTKPLTLGFLVGAAPGIFILGGCRTTHVSISGAELWTIETSEALDRSCRQQFLDATKGEVTEETGALGRCLGDANLASSWVKAVESRIWNNWPADYVSGGPDKIKCIDGLTKGLVLRLATQMKDLCDQTGAEKTRELLAAEFSDTQNPKCSDLVRMTQDGCFVESDCRGGQTSARKERKVCHPGVQKIHKVKDPTNQDLAWNNPWVIELTGNGSSARVTYGAPNCHGTAQAVAGDLLSDLPLEDYLFARKFDEPECGEPVHLFMAQNKGQPIGELNLDPGGILINMQHEDCTATQCGTTRLYVEECQWSDRFKSAIFIDGMCVECWAERLAAKGLGRSQGPVVPGCILTTKDHSVYVAHRSAGFCFTYEATTPYGPPQLRTSPCLALEHKFEHHFCPASSNQ